MEWLNISNLARPARCCFVVLELTFPAVAGCEMLTHLQIFFKLQISLQAVCLALQALGLGRILLVWRRYMAKAASTFKRPCEAVKKRHCLLYPGMRMRRGVAPALVCCLYL